MTAASRRIPPSLDEGEDGRDRVGRTSPRSGVLPSRAAFLDIEAGWK